MSPRHRHPPSDVHFEFATIPVPLNREKAVAGIDPLCNNLRVNTRQQPERIEYLDVLRVLSMLSVVFLHTVAGTLRAGQGNAWHFANVLSSFMSTAVPLFFMISGALLLSSHKTTSLAFTLKTRLPRVLVPFLVWSLLAVFYYFYMFREPGGAFDWSSAIDRLKNLPAQPVMIHLWFMYALIPLYIVSPLLKRLIDAIGRNLMLYLLGLWIFFSVLLPTLGAFAPGSIRPLFVLNGKFDVTFVAGYAGYFIAGYYLSTLKRPISRTLLASIVVVDTACISLGTWWETHSHGQYSESFKAYTGVFILILSCALFLLARELLRDHKLPRPARSVIGFLAPLSFGVYLVHNFVVDRAGREYGWFPATSLRVEIKSYIVVLAISIAVIWLLSLWLPLRYVFTGQGQKRRGG
jgi:surface polysaccharide O-acyltransferase-like enzyme